MLNVFGAILCGPAMNGGVSFRNIDWTKSLKATARRILMSRQEKIDDRVLEATPILDQSYLSHIAVPPMIQKALERHRLDLPELIKLHANQWAAYRGDERLEFGKSKRALYHKYLDRGLTIEELVVLGVEAEPPDGLDPSERAHL
jgi:hypothetical protein